MFACLFDLSVHNTAKFEQFDAGFYFFWKECWAVEQYVVHW